MQEIGTFPQDTLYIRHIHFLDFNKYVFDLFTFKYTQLLYLECFFF